jgi:hypothetical protein
MSNNQNFRKKIEEFREKRRKESLKKARSFKEFLQYKVNYLTIDVCGKYAITGSHIMDYQAFAKMVVSDYYQDFFGRSVNPTNISIDDYFDFYEKTWVIPRRLDPEIIKALEIAIVNMIENLDKLHEEYEQLKKS